MNFLLELLKKYQYFLAGIGETPSKALQDAINKLEPKLVSKMFTCYGNGTTLSTMTNTDEQSESTVQNLNTGRDCSPTFNYYGPNLYFLKIDINGGVKTGDKINMLLYASSSSPKVTNFAIFNPINGQRIMDANYNDGTSWSQVGFITPRTATLNYDGDYLWILCVPISSSAPTSFVIKNLTIERAS